jgi:hypothetical protein
MVRVLGNSPERIKINDLGDVLYYRQQKDYTDQEYETSKDLQREIRNGRVTVIERYQTKGTAVGPSQDPIIVRQNTPVGISSEDIKTAIFQAMAGQPRNGDLVKDVVQTLLPMIGDTIRQEMGRLPRQSQAPSESKPMFVGPEYIPDINTGDLKGNVKGEERTASGADVSSSLAALQRLKKST